MQTLTLPEHPITNSVVEGCHFMGDSEETLNTDSVFMTAMDKNILFHIQLDGYITIIQYKVKHIYYTLTDKYNGTFRIINFSF